MNEMFKTVACAGLCIIGILGTAYYVDSTTHKDAVKDGTLICSQVVLVGKYIEELPEGRWKITAQDGEIMLVQPPTGVGCFAGPGQPTKKPEASKTGPINPKTEAAIR